MSDSLGPVPIVDPPTISAFPLQTDFGGGYDWTPPVAIHVFDQPGLKIEQRYQLGSGTRRFRVMRSRGLACQEYESLKAHFLLAQGGYAQFPYKHYRPDGSETVTARYENPNLAFEHLVGMLCGDPGITLLEVPTVVPAYTHTGRVTRFPDATLTAALLDQVQQFIPLVTVTPRPTPTYTTPDVLYLSNQRCTVDGQLYLPRLLDWGGITQSLGEPSDSANFTFGNADDIWVKFANLINLYRARIHLSFFHVNSNYLIDFWSGYARPWNMTSDGKFILPASDGVFELGIPYPSRTITRTCWKVYKGRFCPSVSSLPDCPKDYNSCVARGVPLSFGGVDTTPPEVRIRDQNTGVYGYGRSTLASISVANDTIYQRPVQEVYTDEPMLVNCDVATGRDEDKFYSALGVVSEGPIGGYDTNLMLHTLDGQGPHDPVHYGGWRGILGTDPAITSDYFAIDQKPWAVPPLGSTYSAGLAFAEIRRTDAAGLQLLPTSDRTMQVTVDQGIGGWVWTAAGARSWMPGLSNTVWVAVNVYLRAIGFRLDQSRAAQISAATMELYFDVNAAIAAAAVCATIVPKLIGTGNERQFPFRGVFKEQKPLKDWLQEILNCCLGYYTFVDGKLWIGIRYYSAAPTLGNAFSQATILYGSLQASPLAPGFNWLDGQFGDEEFLWQTNTVSIYDISAAAFMGDGANPMYTRNSMTFVGVSNKSQCARIVTTRLREELGGVTLDEQRNARNLQFKTTLLGMQVLCGDIVSLAHVRLPGGISVPAHGRVQQWTLNPDFSIDILASATTVSMYDLDVGDKPVDVSAPPVPPELLPAAAGLAWMPNHIAPFAGDPLYPDILERSFDLWQDYNINRDGTWEPAIWVAGEQVVNHFVAGSQPRILGVTLASGGALAGPLVVYAGVTQHTAAGYSTPSNLIGIFIPAGAASQKLTLTMVPADGTWTDWDLYVGTDRRRIAWQSSATAALPGSYDILGPIHPMTRQMPSAAARRVQIAAKHVWHSGVAGVTITGVVSTNTFQCSDFVGSLDAWVGRVVSALADASDGSAPLWNFTITAFVPSTGAMTVTPDFAADPIEVGDVLVVRSRATAADVSYVEDSLWDNFVGFTQFGVHGLTPDEEKGRLARVLRGKGAGQVRQIVSNTAVRIYVHPDWDVIPDVTSVIIVEAPDYPSVTTTSDFDVPGLGVSFEQRLRTENLADRVALVSGYLVDDQGRITDEEFTVQREIYVFGEPPGVRDVGPAANDPATSQPWLINAEDQTIRGDTLANDVHVQLLPLASYHGRTLAITNNNGPHSLMVAPAAGESLFDSTTAITIAPLETVRLTAG